MEIKVIKKQSHVHAEIEVPAKIMHIYHDKVYERIAPSVDIAGFRAGKAPKSMIVEAYGSQRLVNAAIEDAIREAFSELIKKHNLNPLGMPSISVLKQPQFTEDGDAGLKISVEFDVLPKVAFIGDYKKLKLSPTPSDQIKVDDGEVDEALQIIAHRRADVKEVSRGAKKGDRVEISFQGFLGKISIEQLSSKNHPIILGKNSLVPGFEEHLMGMKKGEKKTFNLTFPKTYHAKEFSGKKYRFEVDMQKVDELIIPQINDKFAKELKTESLDELRSLLRKNIEQEKKMRFKQKQEDEILSQLIKMTKVDLPDVLVSSEKERLRKSIEDVASKQNISFDQYLSNLKVTKEKFEDDLTRQAAKNVLIGLALRQIAKDEKIELGKDETLVKVVDWLIRKNN